MPSIILLRFMEIELGLDLPPLSPTQIDFASSRYPAHNMFLVMVIGCFLKGWELGSVLSEAEWALEHISFETPSNFTACNVWMLGTDSVSLPIPQPLAVSVLFNRNLSSIFGVGRQTGDILPLNVTGFVNNKMTKSLFRNLSGFVLPIKSDTLVIDLCIETLHTLTFSPSVVSPLNVWCCPSITENFVGSVSRVRSWRSKVQWAAERTFRESINEPPHLPFKPDLNEITTRACHGIECGVTS